MGLTSVFTTIFMFMSEDMKRIHQFIWKHSVYYSTQQVINASDLPSATFDPSGSFAHDDDGVDYEVQKFHESLSEMTDLFREMRDRLDRLRKANKELASDFGTSKVGPKFKGLCETAQHWADKANKEYLRLHQGLHYEESKHHGLYSRRKSRMNTKKPY